MYIHKYSIGGDTLFRVTKSAAKPSQNITLTADEWKGYSSGSSVQNALKFLNSLKFNKEEREKKKEELKKDQKEQKEPVEARKKMASSVIEKFLKAE